ncbi:MAG: hypothetical protein BGO49_04290 [Planctomycetales bacterium 71-10]|nr:MAG: hypothetical protein BGO49_04290 [Planctomycetales bacterium 71-10]
MHPTWIVAGLVVIALAVALAVRLNRAVRRCPRCGRGEVDLVAEGEGWAERCRSCGWTADVGVDDVRVW